MRLIISGTRKYGKDLSMENEGSIHSSGPEGLGALYSSGIDTGTYRKLNVHKLCPPVEHAKKMVDQGKNKVPRNKVLRFIKQFLGEGF